MKISKRFENDSQALLNIATTFADSGDHKQAKDYFQKSASLAPQSPEIHFAFGSYLLEHLLKDRKRKFSLTSEDLDELKKAEELLTLAIDLLKDSDKKKELRDALVNRSTARIILDKFSEAENDLNFAIELKDSSPLIYSNRGRLHRIRNRLNEAIDDFKKALTLGGSKDDIFPMLASCYLEREDPKIEEFIALIKECYKDEKTMISEALLIECLIRKKEYVLAEERVQNANKKFSRAPRILAAEASLQKAKGNIREFELLMKEASGEGGGLDENMAKLELAIFYKQTKNYDAALPLFEKLASEDFLDPVLRDYLLCLYYSKQNRRENIKKCLKICSKLRLKGQASVDVLELEATIYQYLDRLKEASELFYELMKVEPKQYRHKLNYATTLIEMQGEKSIDGKEILYRIKDDVVDKQYLVLLGKFFSRVGDYDEAIKRIYRALELDFGDAETQLLYVHTFLNRGDKKAPFLDSDTIKEDFYLTIKKNGKEQAVLFSADPKASPSKFEIYKDSGVGRLLLDKRKGDIVKTKINNVEDVYEIVEIKSKYVKAFQEILDNFNTDFPDDKTLQKIKADPEELTNRIRLISQRHSEIVEMYKAKKLPIGVLAKLLNRDIFVTWAGLVGRNGLRLYCASGSVQERNDEQYLVENSESVLVDPISLLTLAELDVFSLPGKLFKHVFVQRATVDEIEAQLLETKGRQKEGFTTLHYFEGKPCRLEVTAADMKKKADYFEKLREAVQQMTIIGLDSPLEDSLAEKEKVYGRTYTYLIQACIDRKLALFSDDFLFRSLVFHEYKIKGFSIQNFLTIAVKKGFLSEKEFYDKIIELAKRNYHYLSVSAQILFYAAEKAHFQPWNSDFEALTNALAEDTTIESLVAVLSDFVRLIYLDKLLANTKARYLDAVLDRLSVNCSPEKCVRILLKSLENKFRFVEFLLPQVQKEAQKWLKSRVIVL